MYKSKWQFGVALTTVALALSACGGPEPTPQDTCQLPVRTGEQPGVICGTLSGVTASQVKPMTGVIEHPKADFIATVTNNNFDLPLPSVAQVNSEYVPDNDPIPFNDMFVCATFTSSASADLRIIPVNSLQADNREVEVMTANANSFTYIYWWFSNKDEVVTANGSGCGTYGSFTNQAFALKKGWNLVKLTLNTDFKNTNFVTSAPKAERLTWKPRGSGATGMVAQSIANDPYFHMPWLHSDKYKDRR